MSDPAVLAVSNVLMPDGAVQTTSQLTVSNVADIANGPTLQTFMRGHLALRMEAFNNMELCHAHLFAGRYSRPINNSSAVHGSSRHRPRRRSRTPPARRFRLRSAPPQRRSDEDDDEAWGLWTSASNPTGDTWRPNEPLGAPAGSVVPMFDLTRITTPPSLGEHCFVLRSWLNIRETAVRIDDVQYYTLPSIAQPQLPAGIVLRGSWESIYRNLHHQ